YSNALYYQFLEESKPRMKEILKNVTGKEFDLKVSSIDKKISNKNNSIRGSKKNPQDEVIEKLKEVFENDLIIEE
ncbi:MAG: DNA polymerase III subunit gamma/tau, partial [Anaerococcus sp.]|nr:DNA polymerase III subunit gamma/tau [Anaerococcus sp.]